jgi:hypothetical protein
LWLCYSVSQAYAGQVVRKDRAVTDGRKQTRLWLAELVLRLALSKAEGKSKGLSKEGISAILQINPKLRKIFATL